MPSFVALKDLKITFKPHPITQDLQVSKDEAAVKQSVVNLLMTVPGERPFNNLLGSRLSELLFEPLDYGVAAQVENEIKDTIERFEPRIDIVDLDVNQVLMKMRFQHIWSLELSLIHISEPTRPY